MEVENVVTSHAENESGQALPEIAATADIGVKKLSFFARLKDRINAKREYKESVKLEQEAKKIAEENRESHIKSLVNTVESQLGTLDEKNKLLVGSLDEQSKLLLVLLSTLQEKNETLEEKKERQLMSTVESHFGNLDEKNKLSFSNLSEQNRLLIEQLSTLRENNDALLDQVKFLRKSNELSKKREMVSKIIAVVSSILAIGLTIYKFLQLLHIVP